MKCKWKIIVLLAALFGTYMVTPIMAQEATGPGAGLELADEADAAPADTGFFAVVKGGGVVGIILWVALLVTSMLGVWLAVDSLINVREAKYIPPEFVDEIHEAMEQGDVLKASQACADNPGALSNILSAAFSNVEDGFDAVQDAVTVAGDLETEKLMQRVNYLNVVGNLAPMLGLLGTVQGMIFAFATLATAGAAGTNLLAMNISQALYTTAAGLMIAIPALALFYYLKNKATKIILNMEMLTLDEIKILRHVEVEATE